MTIIFDCKYIKPFLKFWPVKLVVIDSCSRTAPPATLPNLQPVDIGEIVKDKIISINVVENTPVKVLSTIAA